MITEEMKSFEALRRALREARQDYAVLETQPLLDLDEGLRKLYFARYSLLKELIRSIESLLDANRRLGQLEKEYSKHLEMQKAQPILPVSKDPIESKLAELKLVSSQ